MKEYKLKYGKGEQSVMLDESKVLQIIDAAPGEKITDLKMKNTIKSQKNFVAY